ncbi:MAG: YggS family pyridoxal phosphate-dependent enzyme [Bacillota bacterium]
MNKNKLKSRLDNVKNRIKIAAANVNRKIEDIKLIAVSKTHPVEKIEFFYTKGLKTFGESRAQELRDKNENIQNMDISWHFVGHLQRNKVKYLLRMNNCEMIESLDSWRLAKEINKRAKKNNRIMPLLVEVNVSEEESKFGINPEDTLNFIKKTDKLSHIEIKGLMTLAPYFENPEKTRPYFKKLAKLKDKINNSGFNLTELSMGMSNDFEIAIEEGATIIRIGTALFGPREN